MTRKLKKRLKQGNEGENKNAGKATTIFELKDIIGGKDYPWEFIEPRKAEIRKTCASIIKARALLGWEPKISSRRGDRTA